MKVALLTIGSEILDGRVVDTNSAYLCALLTNLGITVTGISSCDDAIPDVHDLLSHLLKQAACVIVTGGLGPTSDDLTREAVASFIGEDIVLNPASLERLKGLYAVRQRTFDPSNAKQATFPSGAEIIPNPVGTAEGFRVSTSEGAYIICLPGVPRELRAMIDGTVLSMLKKEMVVRKSPIFEQRAARIFGLPESLIGSKVVELNLGEAIKVSYRASFPEVHLLIRGVNQPLDVALGRISAALGADHVYSSDLEIGMPETVVSLLTGSGQTIAVAESCTGGMLGELLTTVAGASECFLGGVIAYSNNLKRSLLNVSQESLTNHGAVSHKTALEMALGARLATQSSIAVSITGIAGPERASIAPAEILAPGVPVGPEKPVGSFFIGLSTPEGEKSYRFFFSSSRGLIRKFAAYKALDVVRRLLSQLPEVADDIK